MQTSENRKFIFVQEDEEDKDLPDPNPAMTPAEVKKLYSDKFPELTNAIIEGPQLRGDTAEFRFKLEVGTKG